MATLQINTSFFEWVKCFYESLFFRCGGGSDLSTEHILWIGWPQTLNSVVSKHF